VADYPDVPVDGSDLFIWSEMSRDELRHSMADLEVDYLWSINEFGPDLARRVPYPPVYGPFPPGEG
jgi:hypothetical protein